MCELLLCRVVAIVGDTLVHDRPQTLNGVKVRAIWRQLDEVDPALWPCKEVPDIRPSVVGGVIPDDMDDAFIGVVGLYLDEKLGGADPINCCGFDKGRVEGFEVQGPMDTGCAFPLT